MTVRLILSVAAVLAAIYFFYYFAEELLEVKTTLGHYKGKVLETHLGTKIAVFKGIPFAKYNERFGDPEPFGEIHTDQIKGRLKGKGMAGWKNIILANTLIEYGVTRLMMPGGLYYATRDMDACTQKRQSFPTEAADIVYSETCLHLNIWVPQPMRNGREVMVYIHGGKYEFGSGSDPMVDGSVLATHGDVIVVTFNYRLGIFGFYYSGIPGNTVGNMGIKDQQLALKWVREHISSFGGDPNKITVFGVSAGASSIVYHLTLPDSKGLFQRAILQSVPSIDQGFNTPDTMNGASKKLFDHFNCKEQNVVTCMRNVSTEEILAGSNAAELNWLPVVDGKFITDLPTTLLRGNNLEGVDVLIGVTRDEGSIMADGLPGIADGEVKNGPKKVFEEVCKLQTSLSPTTKSVEDVCKAYRPSGTSSPDEVVKSVANMLGDRYFVCPTDRLARLLEEQNAKVRLYQLTQKAKYSKYPEHWGVPHAADLQWVFGAPLRQQKATKYESKEEHFSKTVMDLWIQFAKYGDPVLQSNLEWDLFTDEYPVYLELKMPVCFLHRGESIRENFCSLWS